MRRSITITLGWPAVLWDVGEMGPRPHMWWVPCSGELCREWNNLRSRLPLRLRFPDDLKWWATESLQVGKVIPYQGLFDH